MELTDLRYFWNVAEAKSFSGGATRSHISPPAISKSIQRLESELGTKLFTRTTRRVILTEAGEHLRTRCRRIFDEVDGVRRDLEDAESPVSGELRIGAMEVFSIHLLPLALSRIMKRHPRIVPSSHELVPQQMERLIADGQLDVGFTIGAGKANGVDCHSVGTSPGVLVCGRRHPLYRPARITKAGLGSFPFVVPRVLGLEHLPPLDQFPDDEHPRSIGGTFELLQMGIQLVIEGAWLGFFPKICVRDALADGHLRAVKGIRFGVDFDLQVLTRAGTRPKRSARLLIDEVRLHVGAR